MTAGGDGEGDAIAALHLAARRYCLTQHARWADQYAEMQAAKAARGHGGPYYTDDDYRVFPRYIVLEAILSAIERWVPADVATLAEARARLAADARTENRKTDLPEPIAREAMLDERAAFERFALSSTAEEWATAAPLPFHRVLSPLDAHELDRAFVARWGRWYGGWPDRTDLPAHLTLHTEVCEALPVDDAVRGFLAARGVTRLYELREFDDSFEVDLAAATFAYDFCEGRWFTAELDWMVYASHEASITLGGAALLEHVRAALPAIDAYEYRGWSDPPSSRVGFTAPVR